MPVPHTITAGPLELVPSRTLAAEACAATALALTQTAAIWAALATLDLMQQAAAEYEGSQLGESLGQLLAHAVTSSGDIARATGLLETCDRTARSWAATAYPSARATIPHLGRTQ